ncbi:GtrA family protein [Suttonella sp. R2A3]|uniref:GtrA family protein n=1 Tax=Suttonella sp. R2A3 TaxID=2908648 RepID=UPI001F196A79|nr:GtrA family protein [Suttonella sp. R2A3]UJF24434.1 GtrA family protein [Suttonella sp. R2A3]
MWAQQISWFAVVGVSAALTHVLCLWGLVDGLSWPPVWANIGAFCVAFLVSFFGHFLLTFRGMDTRWWASLIRWLLAAVSGFVLNQLLFILGLHLFGEAAYLWVWFVATAIVTLLSFVLAKFWAFRHDH